MSRTTIFVLGLIGSILGILGSLAWMLLGSFFWAGVFDADQPLNAPLTDESLRSGMTIAIIQSLFTLVMFIISLIKSTPGSLKKNARSSGIWLLILGIVSALFNLVNFIPCVLIIISGAFALQRGNAERRQPVDTEFHV